LGGERVRATKWHGTYHPRDGSPRWRSTLGWRTMVRAKVHTCGAGGSSARAARMGSSMLIRCENVSYRYPSGTCALAELSLELAPGRCLGIVGANGAGKSSLLLLMAGLREPSTGTVWLEGERGGR